MITVTCSCGRRLRAKGEQAGKLALCPHCRERVLIPEDALSPPGQAVGVVERAGPGRSRTRFLVVGGVLAAALVAGLIVYLVIFRAKSPSDGGSVASVPKAAPTITASPNPVPAGTEKFGTTTV